MQKKDLVWVKDNWLLLETEKGNAFVQTEKYDYLDYVPRVQTNTPLWILHLFSDPNEQGERTTINVTLSQSHMEKLMEAVANEIEHFAKLNKGADDELAEIMAPVSPEKGG